MDHSFRWVDCVPELAKAVDAIRSATLLAVDTEFIRETTFFPQIALIQIATAGETWIIDPVVLGPGELIALLDILTQENILKIMHAAQGDQECFYQGYGRLVSPVLDTAVAAALLGFGDNIGLGRLVKLVLGESLAKGRSRAHWLRRPLSAELLHYAAEDVRHLVRLAERLMIETDKLGRTRWAMELSRPRPEIKDDSPYSVAERLVNASSLEGQAAGIFYELVVWREKKARDLNRPRGWIAENSVLVSLARSRPTSLADLSHFRGLSPKEVQKSGEMILRAIENGKNRSVDGRSYSEPPSPEEELAIQCLKAFVGVLSSEHCIAPRLLIGTQEWLPLIRACERGLNRWRSEELLSPGACDLIGHDLEDFLVGKRVLGFEKGKPVIIGHKIDPSPIMPTVAH